MAKKWKKRLEEESSSFKAPEFDEREFLVKELKETRILLVTVLFAIIFAFISLGAMYLIRDFTIGAIIGIVGIFSLRAIYPVFKIDISTFEVKKWVISGLSFFGLWLSVWILLCNPPVSDFTSPVVDNVLVGKDTKTINNGDVYPVYTNATPASVSVFARVTDNHQLNTGSVAFSISGQPQPHYNTTKTSTDTYRWDLTGLYTGQQYTISISAKDMAGNQRTFQFTLDVKS